MAAIDEWPHPERVGRRAYTTYKNHFYCSWYIKLQHQNSA